MATKSLFSMLINDRPGNFSEQVVYEDELVVAFLDKFPAVPGHTLVVPREQVEKIHELSPETASALGLALAKVAAKVVEATGTNQYNVLVNNGADSGQEIPHVHFHIIPRTAGDYSQSWAKSIESTRTAANPKPAKLPDNGEFDGDLKTLRDKIRG
uniref:HIT domain-containing protein n=1 Tax=Cryptomonas curvata TaxID=233186 RepID=A0A7S0QQB7_9CRYP